MSDIIQVAIRVRQLIEKEKQAGYKSNWTIDGESISCVEEVCAGRKPTVYTFDYIFDETTVTLDVFNETCKPIVDASLNGFNGTIFAYGQSSSGKTHTMTGSQLHPGIIPLAVFEIFNRIDNIPDREYLIRVSYMEIYNEKLTDLLKDDDTNLKLQEDTERNVRIVGIHEELVQKGSVVLDVMKRGNAKRHTAATKQNDRSSRSHCILRFVIESRGVGEVDEAVKVSHLYFVDLAGSEKAADNSGDRFREGCSINKSLFTLGNVIRKLSGDDHFQHASYRDSKLTRVLQNALGGNSKTAIICTITPAHVEESESTLKFASRAKTITNTAHVNEVMSEAALLKKYQRMVKSLEKKVSEGTDGQLVKQLQEHEASLNEQAETIKNLKKMILISGTVASGEPVPKKRRRETWAPGKRHGKPRLSLSAGSSFNPAPSFQPAPFGMDEPIIEEEEQPAEMADIVEGGNTEVFETSPADVNNFTIEFNPTLKELFELQDKHELLLEEVQTKDKELRETQDFKEMERQMQEETIKELTEKVKDWEGSQQWMEEELMKAQQERNSLRQKVDSMTRQLKSAEQGTGLTEKCEQLADSEKKIAELNSEIGLQKSRYEFHIEQMKQKLESLTGLLEQQGVDSDVIKQRLFSETEIGSEIAELRTAHEVKVNDLQNEIDMLVLSLEREQAKVKELDERYTGAFEEQKRIFTKDIQERDEEIKIYIDLFEQESVPLEERKSRQAEIVSLKDQLEKQQEDYELKLKLLQADLEKYEKANEEENCTSGSESGGLHGDLKVQQQIEFLKAELEQLKSMHEREENEWKNKYESLAEEYQQKMRESNDNMDPQNKLMEAELENLKTLYEDEINSLKEKNENLIARLRRQSGSIGIPKGKQTIGIENNDIVEKYEAEIAELNCQLDKEKKKQMDSEHENKESYDQLVETLKEQMEGMKTEYEAKLLQQKEMIEKLDKSENSTATENVEKPMDLGTELMAVELQEVKFNYEKQIEDLKEIYETKLREVGEQDTSTEIELLKCDHERKMKELIDSYEGQLRVMRDQGNVTTDNFNSLDIDIMKAEMEEMRHSYEEKIMELTKDKSSTDRTVEPSENMNDLQSELLKAEMNEMKERYELQVEELQVKYEQVLAESEQKLDRKGESEDDLRYELLKEEMATMRSSYEEKINELNEKLLTSTVNLDEVSKQIHDNDQEVKTKELLRTELEEMKGSYELKLTDLNEKYEALAADYALKCQHKNEDVTNLKHEMMVTEIDNTIDLTHEIRAPEIQNTSDLKHEMIAAEMKNPIDLKQEMMAATMENVSDLKHEMMVAEVEKMRAAHEEEVNELNEKLKQITSQLESRTVETNKKSQEVTLTPDNMSDEQDGQSINSTDQCTVCCKEKEIFNEKCRMYEDTIKEIGDELASFKQSIKKLSEDIELLQAANKALKTDKIELVNKNADLQEKLEVCIEVLDELKETLKETEEENETFQSSVTENKHLTEKISQMEQEAAVNTNLIAEHETQIKELTETMNLDMGNADYMLQYDNQVKELTEKLNAEKEKNELLLESELQVKELREKLNAEMEKSELVQEYELQIKELRAKLISESANSELIAEYELQMRELSDKLSTEMKKNELVEDYELQVKELTLKLTSLEEQHSELISQYELQIKELSEKLSSESADSELVRGHELQIKDLTQKLNFEMGKNEEIPELKNQIKQLTEKLSSESTNSELLSEYELQIKELTEKLNSECANSDLIAEYELQIKELTERLNSESANTELINEYEMQIKELTEKINSESANSDLIAEYELQIKELTERLNSESANTELIHEYELQIKELTEKISSESANSDLIAEYELQIKELTERLNSESANTELINEYELQIKELTEKINSESANSDLIAEYELQIKELTERLNSESANTELINEYELQIKELTEKMSSESANSDLIAEYELQIKELAERLNSESANTELINEYELQIKEMTEKLEAENEKSDLITEYELQIKELTEKLDSESANTELITEYELQIKDLTEKLSIESANSEKMFEYELQVKELTEKLNSERHSVNDMVRLDEMKQMEKDFAEKIRLTKEEVECELQTLRQEKDGEIQTLEDQLESRLGMMHNMEDEISSLKKENMELMQKVKELETKMSEKQQMIEDLEEDKWMLERNLHPDAIKYHSLPENLDWEKKWDLFVREEKRKRREVRSEILRLRAENDRLEAGAKATVEDAIKILKLTDENISFKAKNAALEEELQKKNTNTGYVADTDHSCKYRQDNLKHLTELDELKEKLESKKQTLEQVTLTYEQRIAKLKNEIRRLGEMDKTFDVGTIKQPSFTEERSASKPKPDMSGGYGSSTSGGIVDYFKVCLVEADNKQLKKDLEKAKKKLDSLEALSKENMHLKESLVKQADSSTLNPTPISKERQALGDVTLKAPPPKSCDPSSEILKKRDQFDIPKTEDNKFDLSCLRKKPEEQVRVERKEMDVLNEDPNKCKTT